MKQLLVALSILGMASTASAGLQISVGGEPHPVSSEIVLAPSDELIIDIWTDSGFAQFEGVTYSMSAMTHYGSLDWSGATFSNPPSTNIINGPWPAAELPPGDNPPEAGFWGSIFSIEAATPADTVLVNNIFYHALDGGDATIWLYEWLGDPGQEDPTVVDAVVIHQGVIPEPMTIALLGLGGLLALRRRK
ncbi:MAG: PEP-CTERM sorting domain-containing protein [Planctomycetota bacterium]|jgi:hypothetical protein